jgi:hypothetical protein
MEPRSRALASTRKAAWLRRLGSDEIGWFRGILLTLR